jgi:hypothetical protein
VVHPNILIAENGDEDVHDFGGRIKKKINGVVVTRTDVDQSDFENFEKK